MEEFKRYTIKDLLMAFKEAGYPVSKSWIIRQEQKGNLIVPKSVSNFKKTQGTRRSGAIREMSMTQILEIVQAFSPGGSGFYDYRKELSQIK